MSPSDFKGTFVIVTATPALEEIRESKVFQEQTIVLADQRKPGAGGFKTFEEEVFLLTLSQMMELAFPFSELIKKAALRGEMSMGSRFGFKIFDVSKEMDSPRSSSPLRSFPHIIPRVVDMHDEKERYVGSFEPISHNFDAHQRDKGPYAPGIYCRMLMSTKNNLLLDFLKNKELIKEISSYFEQYSRERPLN